MKELPAIMLKFLVGHLCVHAGGKVLSDVYFAWFGRIK